MNQHMDSDIYCSKHFYLIFVLKVVRKMLLAKYNFKSTRGNRKCNLKTKCFPCKSRPMSIFLCVCLIQMTCIFVVSYNMIGDNSKFTEKDVITTNILTKTIKTCKSDKLKDIVSEETVNDIRYIIFRFDWFCTGKEDSGDSIMVNEGVGFIYFSRENSYHKDEMPNWTQQKRVLETNRFIEYGKRIVYLNDVQINPKRMVGKEGGEMIDEVLNQSIDKEYMKLKHGYFTFTTNTSYNYDISYSDDLHEFAKGLYIKRRHNYNYLANKDGENFDKTAVISIRHEYANFYHTTMNWYDIFLLMVMFKIDPKYLTIIWLDAHPYSILDDSWATLFGNITRAGFLQSSYTYKHMIWNGIGSKSHINDHKSSDLPLVDEYRYFVFKRFSIADTHILDCSSVKVTIISRRDTVFHPRNPNGTLSRKISNEEDILKHLKIGNNHLDAVAVQLDRIPMKDQLQLISKTDILIGMHGAGLSFTLYIPPTSGIIELFPSYFSPAHSHFRSMAKWRRLPYMSWYDIDKTKEDNIYTTVPPLLLKQMVLQMKDMLCE